MPNSQGPANVAPIPKVIEDMHAPELFVSTLMGVALAGEQVHMTFASFRRNASHSDGAMVVNLRLVMPQSSFKQAIAFAQATIEAAEQKP